MRSSAPERSLTGILPGFWPGMEILARAARSQRLLLLDDRPFSPADGLHRARIRAAAGDTWLSLPVRAARPGTPLHAVELPASTSWAPRIMRVLEHAFDDAPYLEHYRCDLARVLFHGWPRLVDLNEAMLRFLLRAYRIPAQTVRASAAPRLRAPLLHDRVSDRSALEMLLRLGPGARELVIPTARPPARPIRLRVFAELARHRAAQPGFGI